VELNGIGLGIGRLGRNWDFGKRKTLGLDGGKGNSDRCSGHMAGRLRIAEKYIIYAGLCVFGAGEKGVVARVLQEKAIC